MKYRIRRNYFGNWYGYHGRNKVAAFSCESDGKVWLFLKTGEGTLPDWAANAPRAEVERLLAYADYNSEKNLRIYNEAIKKKSS